ncbi:hypothetical protein QBC43DRAFT_83010 [Cladorrhinum sp. PSN259]|nr:hypothetical protein QBC43DRAFT_83010 [Cladorrhinum sp. PSN259]
MLLGGCMFTCEMLLGGFVCYLGAWVAWGDVTGRCYWQVSLELLLISSTISKDKNRGRRVLLCFWIAAARWGRDGYGLRMRLGLSCVYKYGRTAGCQLAWLLTIRLTRSFGGTLLRKGNSSGAVVQTMEREEERFGCCTKMLRIRFVRFVRSGVRVFVCSGVRVFVCSCVRMFGCTYLLYIRLRVARVFVVLGERAGQEDNCVCCW